MPSTGADDAGVAEIDRRRDPAPPVCALSVARACSGLAVEHIELLALLLELRPVERERGLGALFIVDRLLDELTRAGKTSGKQRLLTHRLQMIARHIRLGSPRSSPRACSISAACNSFCCSMVWIAAWAAATFASACSSSAR